MNDLTQAIAELRLGPHWPGRGLLWQTVQDIICHAVASGELIPKEEAEVSLAAMAEKASAICRRSAHSDIAYAEKYPDEAPKYEDRAHWALTLSDAILALAPTFGLEKALALRNERNAADYRAATMLARVVALEADGDAARKAAYNSRARAGTAEAALDTLRTLLRRALDAMSRRDPDGISTEAWDQLVADMAKELGAGNA